MERADIEEWLECWIERYANLSMRRMKSEMAMLLVDFQSALNEVNHGSIRRNEENVEFESLSQGGCGLPITGDERETVLRGFRY
jgi:hypothetical protein